MRKLLSMFAFLAVMMLPGSCTSSDDNPGGNGESPTTTDIAETTVIIYGTAGGELDSLFENYIRDLAPALTDPKQLRVAVLYKYGRDKDNTVTLPNGMKHTWKHTGENAFTGKLADAGDVVKFELTSKTDLTDLRPYKTDGEDYQLWNDTDLTDYLNEVKQEMPAKNYVLIIYGHGGGWDPINDVDYLSEVNSDARAHTRGVLYDEWSESFNGGLGLDMYEFASAVKNSEIGHFSGIYLHSCMMANAECLAQIYDLSDYTICCMHSLITDALTVSMLTKALTKTSDFVTAAKKMMADDKERADSSYLERYINGDMSLIDNKVFPKLFPIAKRLAERLMAVYEDPLNSALINLGMSDVYLPNGYKHFVDIYDLAVKMAAVTKDAELGKIRDELKAYFDRLILAQNSSFYSRQKIFTLNPPKRFTISMLMVNSKIYEGDAISFFPGMTVMDAYEMTNFHKQTGFGNFLLTFDGIGPNPMTNPTGQDYEIGEE